MGRTASVGNHTGCPACRTHLLEIYQTLLHLLEDLRHTGHHILRLHLTIVSPARVSTSRVTASTANGRDHHSDGAASGERTLSKAGNCASTSRGFSAHDSAAAVAPATDAIATTPIAEYSPKRGLLLSVTPTFNRVAWIWAFDTQDGSTVCIRRYPVMAVPSHTSCAAALAATNGDPDAPAVDQMSAGDRLQCC
jgi:hypothetical protein